MFTEVEEKSDIVTLDSKTTSLKFRVECLRQSAPHKFSDRVLPSTQDTLHWVTILFVVQVKFPTCVELFDEVIKQEMPRAEFLCESGFCFERQMPLNI